MKKLKEKIEEEKGKETFPAAGQKLIYAGNTLLKLLLHVLILYVIITCLIVSPSVLFY